MGATQMSRMGVQRCDDMSPISGWGLGILDVHMGKVKELNGP